MDMSRTRKMASMNMPKSPSSQADSSYLLLISNVRILHYTYQLPSLTINTFACPAVIDRTAAFVARSANPPQFEDKIRENQRQDPKFSFLNPADPYHAYYRHYMDKVNRGEVDDEQKPEKVTEKQEEKPVEVVDRGLEPPAPEFILDVSNVNAVDL